MLRNAVLVRSCLHHVRVSAGAPAAPSVAWSTQEPSAGGPCASVSYPAEGSPPKLIKVYPFIPDLTETTALG